MFGSECGCLEPVSGAETTRRFEFIRQEKSAAGKIVEGANNADERRDLLLGQKCQLILLRINNRFFLS